MLNVSNFVWYDVVRILKSIARQQQQILHISLVSHQCVLQLAAGNEH